jgi:hypothetical protein
MSSFWILRKAELGMRVDKFLIDSTVELFSRDKAVCEQC